MTSPTRLVTVQHSRRWEDDMPEVPFPEPRQEQGGPGTTSLVLAWPLNMIDDEHRHHRPFALQLEAKLFL